MMDRIGHINIRTPLLEETLSFYERLLGLKRGEALSLPGPGNAWLFADNGRAVVHVNQPLEGEHVESPETCSRLHHVAFDCRDYDVMEARLKEMGVTYQQHKTALPGLLLMTTKDPNGINVELSFNVDLAIDHEILAGKR